MNAEELFKQSMKRYAPSLDEAWNPTKLPNRIYGSLRRCAVEGLFKEDRNIDPVILLKLVEDGQIWNIRNIGKKSVKVICEWLVAQQETSKE